MVFGIKRLDSHSSRSQVNFSETALYKIITQSPAERIAEDVRKAICVDEEDASIRCLDTGATYMHLVAEHYSKFMYPQALPAVYQLCYAGIDVSAQDSLAGNTVLHTLVCKPNSYKLIIALLRYGVDVSLKNYESKTAEDILVNDNPPGWAENLHWYRKLAPGLYNGVIGKDNDLDIEDIERLLKCWCKVNIYADGKSLSLLHVSQMRAKDAVLAEMLKRYQLTIEFVHATLAGLPDEMRKLLKEGKKKIDVNIADHSYQLDMESPEVPQPLLAAAWEQCNYDIIDILVDAGCDVCSAYSNQSVHVYKPKPLFYQTLLGTPRVSDLNIMLRILENGDLRCKTEQATTFLHESVKNDMPPQLLSRLVMLGAPLEEREIYGCTARELAEQRGNLEQVLALDEIVLQSAMDSDIKSLESLVFQCYDVRLTRQADGKTMLEMAENKELPPKVNKFLLKTVPELQMYMKDLWNCIDRRDHTKLKKYLSNKDMKKIVFSRDRCGRTILLMALYNKDVKAIKLILKKHPKLVEVFDNGMLTSLHYAHMMFEDDYTVANMLKDSGASPDWCCIKGLGADKFKKGIMSEEDFKSHKEFILGYSLMVFANKMTFEPQLVDAVKGGRLSEVGELLDSIRPYGSIKMFSHVVFDAIDAKQEDVAIYLLQQGLDSTVTKQYETCSADNELCAMMECYHPTTTIYDRVKQFNLVKLLAYLDSSEYLDINKTVSNGHNQCVNENMEVSCED